MPSKTLPKADDKAKIKKALPSSQNKIHTATVARLYVAYPDPNVWNYTGIMGALAFVSDKTAPGSFFFRIVDLNGTGGILWEQELYEGFQYVDERPFFHTFTLENCSAAFSFADDHEAKVLFKKVSKREDGNKVKKSKSVRESSTKTSKSGLFFTQSRSSGKKNKGKFDKSMISGPSDFRHVGHIGFDPDTGFSTENIDPEWMKLFDQLGELGFSKEQLEDKDTQKFIFEYVQARGGPNVGATPAAPAGNTNASIPPPPPAGRKNAPPPPPASRRQAPPPPPSRNTRGPPPPAFRSSATTQSKNNIPPPPPPVRGQAIPPPPHALPSASQQPISNIFNLPPSLAIASPPVGAAVPPPPPPPPPMGAGIPPPPPMGSGVQTPSKLPPPTDDRNDLLASIRGAGGIGALKHVDRSETASPKLPSPVEDSAGGGDLAMALANALSARNKVLAHSDSENEDDDDDWDEDD